MNRDTDFWNTLPLDNLPGRVAVTGATGFLGSHLCEALSGLGVEVLALGRNVEKGLALERERVSFRPVALGERDALLTAFRDTDAVVHAAALSTAWAKQTDFEQANIAGTQNVIDAAREAGVRRLVYISSPSVVSRPVDQSGISEREPEPTEFDSDYSRTKLAGEHLIKNSGLETVILRPKAIYGPGDTAILPRLIRAARSGRLRRIGDGHARTNLTHVSDVVQGILLALGSKVAAGRTYTLAGAEEVRIWELIQSLIDRLALPPLAGEISVTKATRLAVMLERTWTLLGLPGEPPLTRYTVSILSWDKTYDISAARQDLGFQPRVSLTEGLEEVIRQLQGQTAQAAKPSSTRMNRKTAPTAPTAAECDFTLLNAGAVTTRGFLFEGGANFDRVRVPALFAVIDHPREGIVLFDTGYTPRFGEATRQLPHCIYGMATPVDISPAETAVMQLRDRGVSPDKVRWIILSHFHPDHYGGLKDFPNATIVCRAEAWSHIAGKSGLAALRAFMLPGHLPDDISARVQLLPRFERQPVGTFAASYDLFGDGSIQLIDLPGHLPGHIGAWVNGAENRKYALIADAVWTLGAIDHPGRGVHRWLASDRRQQDATVLTLQRLKQMHPEVSIIPSHCPVTAELFGTGFNKDH